TRLVPRCGRPVPAPTRGGGSAAGAARRGRSSRASGGAAASCFVRANLPGGERDGPQVLVAGQRGGQRPGARCGEVEVAARRTLVAARSPGGLPPARERRAAL